MIIITGFQLRAARRVLNLTFDQLTLDSQISKVTLSRLENTISNTEDITCSAKYAQALYDYFVKNNLSFPDKNTIQLNEHVEPRSIDNDITRFQFLTARVAMNLSQKGLAEYTELKLGHGSYYRFEEQNNNCYLKSSKIKINTLILFFKEHGVYFPNNQSVKIKNNS